MKQAPPAWTEAYKRWYQLNQWTTNNSKGFNQGQKVELANSITRYLISLSTRGADFADEIYQKFLQELQSKNIRVKGDLRRVALIPVPTVPTSFMVRKGTFKCGDFFEVLPEERYKLLRSRGSDKQILLMLLEYAIYSSPSLNWQIPRAAYQYMLEKHGLTLEGCASPINSQMLPLGGRYCSPHIDSDAIFGSIGNLFTIYLKGEVVLINPPFIEDIMKLIAIKIEISFAGDHKPTTIVIIVPQWSDSEYYTILADSPHLKARYELVKGTYSFEECNEGKKVPAKFNSTIFVFSNVTPAPDVSGILEHFK